MPNQIQNMKFAEAVAPGVIKDNAAFTATEIDTGGFNYLTICLDIGATDIAFAAMSLQSATTTGGSFANVTGFVGGTDFTLPSATDDNTLLLFHIDCRGKNQFWKVAATAGDGTAGTYMSGLAVLSLSDQPLTTAALQGAGQVVYG